MTTMLQTAATFFEACETGKSWDGCKARGTADATFSTRTAVLPRPEGPVTGGG